MEKSNILLMVIFDTLYFSCLLYAYQFRCIVLAHECNNIEFRCNV